MEPLADDDIEDDDDEEEDAETERREYRCEGRWLKDDANLSNSRKLLLFGRRLCVKIYMIVRVSISMCIRACFLSLSLSAYAYI